MKHITLKTALLLGVIFVGIFWAFANARAQQTFLPDVLPITDSKHYVGTTTGTWGLRAWLRVIADSFYDTDASDGCAEWVSNVLTSTGSACGSGSGGGGSNWTRFNTSGLRPATSTDQVVIGGTSTTTRAGLEIKDFVDGSLLTLGSTTLQNFTFVRATGTAATTTNSFASVASSTNLFSTDGNIGNVTAGTLTVPNLTSALTLTGAGGLFAEYTGTTCTNQFVRALSALGVATCATVTSSDIDSTITPSSRTITVAGTANQITSSAGAQDLSANRTWTLSIPTDFRVASTTITGQTLLDSLLFANATGTNATTTGSFHSAVNISFNGEILPDGAECANGEILKKTGANNWDCAADDSGGGSGSSKWSTSTADSTAIHPTSAAKVGIGTTSPFAKLSITGTSAQTNPLFEIASSTEAPILSVYASTSPQFGVGTSTPQWPIQPVSATRPQLTLSDSGLATFNHWSFRNAGGLLYFATSSPTTFGTSSIPAMVIDANGRLGIGTSTPGTQLSIQGVANFGIGTSTLYGTGGINVSAGCFAINGTCVGGGSGGSGAADTKWATSTNGAALVPNAGTAYGVIIGATATTVPNTLLEVVGGAMFDRSTSTSATSTSLNVSGLDKLTVGSWTVSTSTDVGVSGTEYSLVQSAINDSWRPIRVKQGTFSEQLTIANTKTKIVGDSLLSILSVNGATQSPAVEFNTKDETWFEGMTISEVNATDVGVAASSSNSSLNRILFNRFNNFATSTQIKDGANNSFYSLIMGNTFFNPQTCLELGGTQANANISAFNRCRPTQTDGSGGYGHFLSDARGFSSYSDDIEGTTTSNNITGIFADATARDISYFSPWIEANTTGVNVSSGATRFNMFGGTISSNGTDLTDSGTDSLFLGVNVTGKTLNQIGTPLGVGTTTSYDAASVAHAFGVTGSSLFDGDVLIDNDDLYLRGASADIRSDTDLDIYPGNQTTRALRIGDGTTNLLLSALGSSEIQLNDSLYVNGNATTSQATTTHLAITSLNCSASNQLLQTNSAGSVICGTDDDSGGSGSAADTFWASSTGAYLGIYPNAGTNTLLGIGTTTPWAGLTVASSTGIQMALTDGSLTSNQWTFRNISNSLFIATSSPSTFATSTRAALTINPNGFLGIASTSPFAQLSVGTGGGQGGTILTSEAVIATSTTPTINWLNGNQQLYRHGTSATTMTFSNYTDGASLRLIVCNPGSTAGAITFPTDIRWANQTKPSQTTTANRCDTWSFISTMGTSSLIIIGSATTNH